MEKRTALVGAFAVVYLVWGSTYLAIDIAIETMPPLAMASMRFAFAGVALMLWARKLGAPWPNARELIDAGLVGVLMLAVGNGALSVAETRMPIGVAALLIATVPMWMVGIEAAVKKRMPTRGVIIGLLVGLAGVGLLSQEGAGWEGGLDVRYVVLILAGAAAWALGSLLGRSSSITSMRMRAGSQMAVGAISLGLMSMAAEPRIDFPEVSVRSWLALAYLATAGSVLAFTCYVWLLRTVSAAAVGTYAFVNPVVAMGLGAAFLSEPMVARSFIAAALILGAVVIINRSQALATVRN